MLHAIEKKSQNRIKYKFYNVESNEIGGLVVMKKLIVYFMNLVNLLVVDSIDHLAFW